MKQTNRTYNPLKLALLGVLTALVFVITVYIRIPTPVTNGYINIGDAIIFLTSAYLGPIYGFIAGGLGSALADCIGYVHWAPWTFFIKGIEGLICGLLFKLVLNKERKLYINALLAIGAEAVAAGWMATMYFFASWIISGLGGAVESVPSNIIQGVLSMAIAIPLIFNPQMIKAINRILAKMDRQLKFTAKKTKVPKEPIGEDRALKVDDCTQENNRDISAKCEDKEAALSDEKTIK